MHLYIPAMDAVLVAFDEQGRIQLDSEPWIVPSLQERRAVVHAAEEEIETLRELIDVLTRASTGRP